MSVSTPSSGSSEDSEASEHILHNATNSNSPGATLPLIPRNKSALIHIQGASLPVMDIIFELTIDGVNFITCMAEGVSTGTLVSTVVVSTAPKLFRFTIPPGSVGFRARVANRLTGTVTVIAYLK